MSKHISSISSTTISRTRGKERLEILTQLKRVLLKQIKKAIKEKRYLLALEELKKHRGFLIYSGQSLVKDAELSDLYRKIQMAIKKHCGLRSDDFEAVLTGDTKGVFRSIKSRSDNNPKMGHWNNELDIPSVKGMTSYISDVFNIPGPDESFSVEQLELFQKNLRGTVDSLIRHHANHRRGVTVELIEALKRLGHVELALSIFKACLKTQK